MKQSIKISKIATVEKIEYIMKNVCETPEAKVKAAVMSMRSNDDCVRLMKMFSEQNNDFAIESVILLQHKTLYNRLYATNHNGLYNGAYLALYNAKKQLLFLYVLMNSFSKKPVQSNPFIHVDTDSFDFIAEHSKIGLQPIQLELFDNMDPVREGLIKEILRFLNRLDKNLQICIDVLDEEDAKMGDNNEMMHIFENQIYDLYDSVKNSKKKRNTDAKYYQDLLDYKNNPLILPYYFHRITIDELKDVVSGLRERQLADYTLLQRKVFAEDIMKLEKFKFVVSRIDVTFTKVSGELLCHIYKYTGCGKSYKSFIKCFKEEYDCIGGKYSVVSPAAFSDALKKVTQEDYNKFCSIIDRQFLNRPVSFDGEKTFQYPSNPQ